MARLLQSSLLCFLPTLFADFYQCNAFQMVNWAHPAAAAQREIGSISLPYQLKCAHRLVDGLVIEETTKPKRCHLGNEGLTR